MAGEQPSTLGEGSKLYRCLYGQSPRSAHIFGFVTFPYLAQTVHDHGPLVGTLEILGFFMPIHAYERTMFAIRHADPDVASQGNGRDWPHRPRPGPGSRRLRRAGPRSKWCVTVTDSQGHAIAYEAGGRTCICNGNRECRHDHRMKQDPTFQAEQLPNGNIRWTMPSGRQYVTEPTRYPI